MGARPAKILSSAEVQYDTKTNSELVLGLQCNDKHSLHSVGQNVTAKSSRHNKTNKFQDKRVAAIDSSFIFCVPPQEG